MTGKSLAQFLGCSLNFRVHDDEPDCKKPSSKFTAKKPAAGKSKRMTKSKTKSAKEKMKEAASKCSVCVTCV